MGSTESEQLTRGGAAVVAHPPVQCDGVNVRNCIDESPIGEIADFGQITVVRKQRPVQLMPEAKTGAAVGVRVYPFRKFVFAPVR
jgi:hypothetical protein